jgi:hypothetical protein
MSARPNPAVPPVMATRRPANGEPVERVAVEEERLLTSCGVLFMCRPALLEIEVFQHPTS